MLLAWIALHFGQRDRAVFANPKAFGFSSIVLLLDGLDEARDPALVLDWVARWSAEPLRSVVITTRPSALAGDAEQWFNTSGYRRMNLLPFDRTDLEKLLGLRMDDVEKRQKFLEAAGGEACGSPWLWSLRIFLFQNGQQYWKSEPMVR